MEKTGILFITNDVNTNTSLKKRLEEDNFSVKMVADGNDALDEFSSQLFAVACLDYDMPNIDGMEMLRALKKFSNETAVIVISKNLSIEKAVEIMREGASDCLEKPVNYEKLIKSIQKSLNSKYRIKEELPERIEDIPKFEGMVGKSPKMQEIFKFIEIIAPTDVTVLIQGESGTGKGLVAYAIHRRSLRKGKPFIEVSCAALAEHLLESELFGHVKGAFTGAIRDKVGRFKLGDGGTIFLDEIGEFTTNLQSKLLRVLQSKKFEPVGSNETVEVDTRIIAATNRDLQTCIKDGTFREDLYYRLNVVTIYLPPLRERREDIPLLAWYFVNIFGKKHNKKIDGITPEALDYLKNAEWRGNIRELENSIERAVIFCRGNLLTPDDLLVTPSERQEGDFLEEMAKRELSLEELEKEYIKTLLERFESKEKVAEILKIDKATLWRKRAKYGLK